MKKIAFTFFILIISVPLLGRAQSPHVPERTFLAKAIDVVESFREKTGKIFADRQAYYESQKVIPKPPKEIEPGSNYITKDSAGALITPLYGVLAVFFSALVSVFAHGVLFYTTFFFVVVILFRYLWRSVV